MGIIQLMLFLATFSLKPSQATGQELFGKAKNNYRNFSEKRTMVVVNETDFTDLSIADAVKSGWRISLYELCSVEKFNKIMTDTNYYFLLRVEGKFRKEREANLEFLTLVKGSPEAHNGIEKMDEIVSMPLQPVGDESGKAFILMPALINIMQEHILNVSDDILKAYVGNSFYSNRVDGIGDKVLMIERGDIGSNISDQEIVNLFGENIVLSDPDEIANALSNAKEGAVAGFTVSPSGNGSRGYSYKMLIDTRTHELIFYRRHRISSRNPAGFTLEDLRRISTPYRIK